MHIVTYLFHFFACSSSEDLEVSITHSEKIPTVIQATVRSSSAGSIWISGESAEQIWTTTTQNNQTEAEFTILGLRPNSEHQITIHWEDESRNKKEKNTSISVPALGEISSAVLLMYKPMKI